jgi:hypothetical protein
MNRLFIVFLTVFLLSCTPAQQSIRQPAQQAAAAEQSAAVELTFTFTRQTGPASNQYAVWIEDARGQHVKTLYAARWTANGGFNRRPTSIPLWVQRSGLANMPREQVNAVSGATPGTGVQTYTWDGTDAGGAVVPDGDYVLVLEGTLRWENQVYYRAPIALGKLAPDQTAAAAQVSVEYTGTRNTTAERAMISGVEVRVLR